METIVDIDQEPLLKSGRRTGKLDVPVATITFRRVVPPDVKIEELPVEEGVTALFTVQNNFADFILPRLADGNAFRVRFAAAEKNLEEFYEGIVPRIEAAYGVRPKKRIIQTEDGPLPGFILDSPPGHRLPKPKN